MAKKDKKSKTVEQKARVAAKQSKKATQKEKKVRSKGGEDSDADVVDLESVLEEYAKQQALFLKVTEVVCDPPSPRTSSTLIGSPSSSNELFLFGGEYYNGALASFFNDLFVYLIDRGDWRKVTSPNSPLPRSGHAWCRGGNTGGIYLFGGEFSSPKQGTFYHYNDFWRLDTSTREWTRLETKGKGPPARSGHRMTYYKNYIVLFGGFQDTSQQTKYLQDLWLYDCHNFVWHNPSLPASTQKPDARSSFSFLPHELGAVLYGGYSRIKATTMAGRQTKGGNQGTRSILKPMIHQDTWFLRIVQPATEAPSGTIPIVRWERRKKPANPPNPPRAGATMVYHKGRGILFGGVHDIEESEEAIESEFFDQLFAWNIERNRYFQLILRRPRAINRRQPVPDRGNAKRGRARADEEDLLKNLAALEAASAGTDPDAMEIDTFAEEQVELSKPEQQVLMTMPHPRFNAQLAVQDDVLFIFGGTYEHGEREYTFDEMYSVDLGKLDGVREIYHREIENWVGSDEDESGSQDEGDSEDDEMSMEGSEGVPLPREDTESVTTTMTGSTLATSIDNEEEEQAESLVIDLRPHPRAFESLRDFYIRTSNEWQEAILESSRKEDATLNKSVKEVKKGAFELAETKWWDSREEITALEDQQEEAGVGEVISMKDRGSEAAGGGRRR
ncbi:hypothetical protein MMC19_000099 [Ptychographa xylographoides]|nr:hypothetical protein [Ptychographa xylographoides]